MSQKRKVVVCYDERDRDSESVDMVRDGLTEAGLLYMDIHRDGTPGRPEISQMAEMVTEAVWTVLVFTPALLQTEYNLAVIARISEHKGLRNIIVCGSDKVLSIVPVWLVPLCFMKGSMSGTEWVHDVINTIRKPPKSIVSPEVCLIPEYPDPLTTRQTKNTEYFSDPNPLSSEEDGETSRHMSPFRARKTRLRSIRQRQTWGRLYRNPTPRFTITGQARDLMSMLQEWAWSMAMATNVLDQHDSREDYSITINTTGVTQVRQNVTFDKINIDKQSKVVYISTYANRTREDQCYEFRISRETDASVHVMVDSGIIQPEFTIEPTATADVRQVSGFLFKDKVSITSTHTKQRSPITWGCNRTLRVPGMRTTECRLIIDELASSWRFTSGVELLGKVDISVQDKGGAMVMNLKPKIAKVVENIHCVDSDCIRVKNDVVSLTNCGKMKLKGGVSQRVEIIHV